MTIKTLEIIHDALKESLERQKMENDILETALNKSKEKGAPDREIKLSEKILKSSLERMEDIQKAIEAFENACVVMGGQK